MDEMNMVFKNAEERELWRAAVFASANGEAIMAPLIVHGKVQKIDHHKEADNMVLAYRARCGEAKVEERDERPWAVWLPRLGEWMQHEGHRAYKRSVIAFFDKQDAHEEAAVAFDDDSDTGPVIAPFPRTLAEVKNGPAASGGGE